MKRDEKKHSKGQAMVEFLFVVVLFVSFVLVTLQFTLIANAKSLLNVAAYVSTRGATHPYKHSAQAPEKQILQPIWDDLKPFGSKKRYNIKFEPWLWDTKFGDKQKNTLTIHYKTPIFRIFGGKKYVVLKASSTSFKEGTCK